MDTKAYSRYLIALVPLSLVMSLFPVGETWAAFNVQSVDQFRDPYTIPNFIGFPFAFFVLPHSLLNLDTGNAINLALNVWVIVLVARKYGGTQWHIALAITMTNPIFVSTLINNNIDWIPLLAFLAPDWLAYPLLAMKPQVLGASAIIRFKRNPRLITLLPLALVLIVSVLIWGAWWSHLGRDMDTTAWNLAPFPYLIPVGLYLLWVGLRRDDAIIAACATPFFVPYFALYSLSGLHVLLACRHRNAALALWVFVWWYFIITARWMAAVA